MAGCWCLVWWLVAGLPLLASGCWLRRPFFLRAGLAPPFFLQQLVLHNQIVES
jgi:hypothetical protein